MGSVRTDAVDASDQITEVIVLSFDLVAGFQQIQSVVAIHALVLYDISWDLLDLLIRLCRWGYSRFSKSEDDPDNRDNDDDDKYFDLFEIHILGLI